jgi:hypothetical protein
VTRWLDFSGAPPLLIPKRLVQHWHGSINPSTGKWRDLDTESPRTDYDRACASAWPGRGVIDVGEGSALAIYTEFDAHSWDAERCLVLCGGWVPSDRELSEAEWSDPLVWDTTDSEFLLMNSAANGAGRLLDDDFLQVVLEPGSYVVEYTALEGEYLGCFHRFTRSERRHAV